MRTAGLKRRRGFILVSILIAVVPFVILIIPVINWTANEFLWTTRSFMALQALNLADAGAENAIWEIAYNQELFTTWSGTNPKTIQMYSFTDASGSVIGDIEVSALNTSPGNYLITSTGYVPSHANYKARKIVKVKVFPHALFNSAIFGDNSVQVIGSGGVDSYDSTLGPYSVMTARDNADVGSNGSVLISGAGSVHGNLFVGPSGTVTGNDPAHVTGETYYSGNEVELTPTVLPGYLAALPSQGSLNLSGKNTAELPTGYYHYSDIVLSAQSSLTVSSNSQIYVSNSLATSGSAAVITYGGVKIYIGGSGNFAGQGIVNTTGSPSNLQIYGLGTCSSLYFAGGSDFYGSVYAPTSSITLAGNAAYYGATIGNDVSVSGILAFHYDESLAYNGPTDGYDIAYWQEE